MNVEITKYKNNPSVKILANRISRLENILLQLGNSTQNTSQATKNTLGTGDSLSELILSSADSGQLGGVNQANTPTIKPKNTAKTGRDNLLLSKGQIIAELAAAIARASGRNS